MKEIGRREVKELGLVGTSEATSPDGMIPERLTVAAYIHRLSGPSARSANGPPNSLDGRVNLFNGEVKDFANSAEKGIHIMNTRE